MIIGIIRWLGKNLSTLIMAFLLALIVWVSAVNAADPYQERLFPERIPLEVIGKSEDLILIGTIPDNVLVIINAPSTVWNELVNNPRRIDAWIDLSELGAGEHTVPVQVDTQVDFAHVTQVEPQEVDITLEPQVTQTYPVTLVVNGTPNAGYEAGEPNVEPSQVVISGAQSLISQVSEVRAEINIEGLDQTFDNQVQLQALDENGDPVTDTELRVTITPPTVRVTQPVELLGGYRNVIVKVITTGQIADGYKLTNMQITPPNVVVFSSDPQRVNELPGYVETEPLDLTGVEDYLETPLSLNLPPGIEVVNDQKVLVQVGIAAIESNVRFSLPVDVIGLTPGLASTVAPNAVDLILSGPLPVLSSLKPSDVRLVVDLAGKGEGTYQITPTITFLPSRVRVQSMLPGTVEVSVLKAPTATPTLATSVEGTPNVDENSSAEATPAPTVSP